MTGWRVGDITIDRVGEMEGPLFPPAAVFPKFDPAALEAHGPDLVPRHYDPALGRVIGTVQSFVIRTGGKTILVDTCCGNGKQRPFDPGFHNLNTPYLERLADIGVTPESVDIVFLTHLHVDHVGWNTRLVDGQWVPTFPNATHVFSAIDLDWVRERVAAEAPGDNTPSVYTDSIAPILAECQTRVITEAGELLPGLTMSFTPGHTPGHLMLRAASHGEGAVFVGDVVQHPLQVYRPDWSSAHCVLPDQAVVTRRRVLGDCADAGDTLFACHFANPYQVRIARRGDNFALT